METHFTPLSAVVGGVLIGVASALSLVMNGKVPGISGLFSRIFAGKSGDTAWRVLFLVGMSGGAMIAFQLEPKSRPLWTPSTGTLILGGLLVGLGTRLGGGCTSGHGICGVGMGGKDSLVATLVFMGTGMLAVFLLRHIF